MHTLSVDAKRPAGSGSGRGVFWTWLVIRVEEMMTTWRERRALLAASDHMLRDLGLSRADAYREAADRFGTCPAVERVGRWAD
jgi:uncharacterized protein YjiS (DUF1127 family)